jgi:hypothetical protein
MTKHDDKGQIRGAQADEAELRRHCLQGSEKYRAALIAAGFLLAPRVAA